MTTYSRASWRWSSTGRSDWGYDSDPLREELAARGYVPPHRKGRKRPPTPDGRRYRRRCVTGRTFAPEHSYRRVVTRFEKRVQHYDGFVHLACAFISLSRLVK